MSDINAKRAFVYGMYSGQGWHKKVEAMSDAQIVAIYLREQGKPRNPPTESSDNNGPEVPF